MVIGAVSDGAAGDVSLVDDTTEVSVVGKDPAGAPAFAVTPGTEDAGGAAGDALVVATTDVSSVGKRAGALGAGEGEGEATAAVIGDGSGFRGICALC